MNKALKYLVTVPLVVATSYGCSGSIFYSLKPRKPAISENIEDYIGRAQPSSTPSRSIENLFYQTKTSSAPKTKLPANMYGKLGDVVHTKYNGIKDASCAGYAYAVANSRYKKQMKMTDAWNAYISNKVVSQTKNAEHIRKLILNKTLKPGMLLAGRYPVSSYNNRIDKNGKPARYTHLAVFAGTDEKGGAIFMQNIYGNESKITLDDYMKMFTPIEIIDEPIRKSNSKKRKKQPKTFGKNKKKR